MLSKEEILDKFEPNEEYSSYYHEQQIFRAMDEYAKQTGIDFIEWTLKAKVEPVGGGYWEDHKQKPMGEGGAKVITTEQLYQQYLNSKANATK